MVRQGRISNLSLPTDYLHDLEARHADTDEKLPEEDQASGGEPQRDKKTDTKIADQTRKTGDWTSYKYYIHAMGWWRLATFLLLVAVNEAFTGLQCKCPSALEMALAASC